MKWSEAAVVALVPFAFLIWRRKEEEEKGRREAELIYPVSRGTEVRRYKIQVI
jgi:hypothetical protein